MNKFNRPSFESLPHEVQMYLIEVSKTHRIHLNDYYQSLTSDQLRNIFEAVSNVLENNELEILDNLWKKTWPE